MPRPFHELRPTLLSGLVLAIPAFYLILSAAGDSLRHAGSLMYIGVAVLVAVDLLKRRRLRRGPQNGFHASMVDGVDALIMAGAVLNAIPGGVVWPVSEWVLRLAFCSIVFARIITLFGTWITPNRLTQILALAVGLLGVAGAGFYWLEPKVLTYADGLWLAFTTGATVGYGDLVPSTPASRIFAAFMVVLGYALLSIVTASIAALFVGEDEKRLQRELHADLRALRREIDALRQELRSGGGHRANSDPLD